MANYEKSENISPEKQAKFNSMQAILYRINLLWFNFNNLVLAGKLIQSNWVLDRIWGELIADSKEDDEKKFKELKERFLKFNKIKERNELYSFIMEKEEFLKKLQNRQGKGVAYEESVEDYMD